jgi:hypothetical protein
MSIESEKVPVAVPETAKQTGEARPLDWVERSIWTDRMLEALEKGVKGDVWFSLIGSKGISGNMDHFRWPNKFFREHGFFSLVEAHSKLLQSSTR